MKQKVLGLVGIGLGVLLVTISGCAANRVSLADEGIVSVETVPGKKVKILWTDVYEDDNDVVVYGVLRRIGYSSGSFSIHVDVTVFSPDEEVLYENRTSVIGVPRRVVGKGVDWKRFEVRFPGQIPEGSSIRAVCHAGRHNDEKSS
ncbi:MAG TPA: hypothetical protein ENK70_03730 [Methylophaga sp.]|nr:hypothetical protein [Methylophaga sp.]